MCKDKVKMCLLHLQALSLPCRESAGGSPVAHANHWTWLQQIELSAVLACDLWGPCVSDQTLQPACRKRMGWSLQLRELSAAVGGNMIATCHPVEVSCCALY